MNADPWIQFQLWYALDSLAQGLQVLEEVEAGSCGADCSVFVGHRIAEAHQQPLLVALDDRPVEPAHRLLAGLLKGSLHLGLVLRVEVFQIRVGLEQFAATDQHSHLPALGFADGVASGRGRREADLR